MEVTHPVHPLEHQVSVLLLTPELPEHVTHGRKVLLLLPDDVLRVRDCHLLGFGLLLGCHRLLHRRDGGRGVGRG